MRALLLFLDVAASLPPANPDDAAVYRQALADHSVHFSAFGREFQRCGSGALKSELMSYIQANVRPSLPRLPGTPGGPLVGLSSIIWRGNRAALEINLGSYSYCSTYRREGATFKLESESKREVPQWGNGY